MNIDIDKLIGEIKNITNFVELDNSTKFEDPDTDPEKYQMVVTFKDGFRKVLNIDLGWNPDLEKLKWYLNLDASEMVELISPTITKTIEKFEDGSYSFESFYYTVLITDDGEISVIKHKV